MDEKELKKILEILNKLEKKNPGKPVSSDDLKGILEIEYKPLLSDVRYLRGKDYIEISEFFGDNFEVKITPPGIVKVEEMG